MIDRAARFNVVSYNYARAVRDELDDLSFDTVTCDEAHYLRGEGSARTRNVLGGGRGRDAIPEIRAGHWTFLTGTPVEPTV